MRSAVSPGGIGAVASRDGASALYGHEEMIAISGYANPVKKLDFPELSTGPEDPVWVVIRNPKTQPLEGLLPGGLELDGDGKPNLTTKQAIDAGRAVSAKLIVAWRVYDATTSAEYDPLTGEEVPGTGQQQLLPAPSGGNGVHPDLLAKVPSEIALRISQEIAEAVNPQPGPGAPTAKTSSSSPSPSSMAPGDQGQPPPSSPISG